MAAFQEAPPGTLLLPWARDPHPDHRAVWDPLVTAARAFPGVRLLAYTVWPEERGEPGNRPQPGETRPLTLAVAPWLERKRRAILAHRTQPGLIADDPHGFTLPEGLIERALTGRETYHEPLSLSQEVPA